MEEPAMSRNVISCTQPVGHGNDFELIPRVQVKSQHSVGWPTCHDFPIFVIISETSRPEIRSRWRRSSKICLFRKKSPYGQIFTNVFRKNSSSLRSTSCLRISWNLADLKSVKSCVIYLTKKTKFWLDLPLSLLRGSRPKSARTGSRQYTRRAPNFIRIRTLPAEL